MPRRKTVLATGEYYHLYNRSTGGITIFEDSRSLKRALSLFDYYRFSQKLRYSKYAHLPLKERVLYESDFRSQIPLIEVFSFCFMPNHYHFLVKQLSENGITKFISNFQNGYAKYFNLKNNRSGVLYQGPYKVKHIENDNYLLHLSRYIHLNPVTSYLIELDKLDRFPWTSLAYYLNRDTNLVNTEFLLNIAGGKRGYKEFVYNQADYQRKLKEIKDLSFE